MKLWSIWLRILDIGKNLELAVKPKALTSIHIEKASRLYAFTLSIAEIYTLSGSRGGDTSIGTLLNAHPTFLLQRPLLDESVEQSNSTWGKVGVEVGGGSTGADAGVLVGCWR